MAWTSDGLLGWCADIILSSPVSSARRSAVPATNDTELAEEERRAEEVYDRVVRPALRPEDDGKFVVVAFEADDFEVDADEYAAFRRLQARRPEARLWLMRTGREPAYRIRRWPGEQS
jgi:hypothetical protein